jgi:hypothetical protein
VDDGMPRRRRAAKTAAIDADAERGFLMRLLLRSPKDAVAGTLALAAVSGIIANALFLQTGHHAAPMFGSVVVMPPPNVTVASPLPRPRPAEADTIVPEARVAEARPAEKALEPKQADPLGNLVKATGLPPAVPSIVQRPPAPIPVIASPAARRVAAVQRALTEYGYGQLKPTGSVGPDTQAAISKFEHERKMPVTGQVSDRLVRELAAMIGHPID